MQIHAARVAPEKADFRLALPACPDVGAFIGKAMRKAIGKKTRFEVFKRDSFKCQYCGRSAPDVTLQVDHITAVATGGTNDIINLLTACFDCNSGKGARALSDSSTVAKQRASLQEVNERRQQIEMMAEWRAGLLQDRTLEVDKIVHAFESVVPGQRLNDHGRQIITKWLAQFTMDQIIAAIHVGSPRYLALDADGRATADSTSEFIAKIPGIARINAMPADDKALYYIRGIVRNRFGYCDQVLALSLLQQARDAGYQISALKQVALSERSWTAWRDEMASLVRHVSAAPNAGH